MTDEKAKGPTNIGEPAPVAYLDSALWRRLLESSGDDAVLSSWLALQCAQAGSATRGVLVTRRTGSFRPVAFWPEDGATSRFLMETVNEALSQRIDIIRENKTAPDTVGIARLVRQDARIIAVVGIEVAERSERARQDVLRRLQWGSAWVEVFERRRVGQSDEHAIERLTLALEAIAVAGEQTGLRAASVAALTSLCVQTRAARISFGVRGARGCKLLAVSNTTRFDRRVELVRTIVEAMDEAADQGTEVTAPPSAGDAVVSTKASVLSDARGGGLVIAQPFVRNGRPAGVFVFEWLKEEAPPDHLRSAVADIAALLGPILDDRYREDQWLVTRLFAILWRWLARAVGPGYLGLKASLLALAAIVTFFAVYKTDFRVTADARLRGAVERVVMAPIDGYILEAAPRAGETVATGDMLVRLDDVEFQLELYAWTARKLQYETEYAQALAAFDRAGINILRARIAEAEAQIALNQTRVDLTRVTAPFDAVVVSGDLSQSLGQSVQRGDELYRIAPLNTYLVELEVPEGDVLFVDERAGGTLVLTSLPDARLALMVTNVTPVTVAKDGKNHFLVEASLAPDGAGAVAPGMEGIAKIDAGEARLIWIWTRQLTDWLHLFWWRWVP
ncbi:MAG: HlyD family efflux transporter periplasmic adaptor subunit [Pseudomonadota bacterium]